MSQAGASASPTPDAPVVPRAPSATWRTVRYVAGAILGAAAFYVCFATTQWPQFIASFRTAHVEWVVAAVISVLLTLALVTARWALLVDANASARSWRALWDSVVVGQAVNIVFPLRFGEGARLAYMCHKLGFPAGRVILSLAVERTFDVGAFGTTVLILTVIGWTPDAGSGAVPKILILASTAIAAVASFAWLIPVGGRSLRRRLGTQSSIGRWIETQEIGIRNGWTSVTRPHLLIATVLLTASIVIAAASTNLLIFRAFGLQVPAVTALALLAVLQLGTAVVSVPGNLGVFHYLTVITLGALHVPRSTALAAAVVLHAVSLGPKVALGGLALAAMPLRRRRVAADGREA